MEPDNTGILFLLACIVAGGVLAFVSMTGPPIDFGAIFSSDAFGCAETSSAEAMDKRCDLQEIRYYQRVLAGESPAQGLCQDPNIVLFPDPPKCRASCMAFNIVSQIRLEYDARTSEPDTRAHSVLEDFKRREGDRLRNPEYHFQYYVCDDRGCLFSNELSFLNDEAQVTRLLKGDRSAIAPLPAAPAPSASAAQPK